MAIFRVLELKTLKMEVEAAGKKKGAGVFYSPDLTVAVFLK
jgi:hypothetical protein